VLGVFGCSFSADVTLPVRLGLLRRLRATFAQAIALVGKQICGEVRGTGGNRTHGELRAAAERSKVLGPGHADSVGARSSPGRGA